MAKTAAGCRGLPLTGRRPVVRLARPRPAALDAVVGSAAARLAAPARAVVAAEVEAQARAQPPGLRIGLLGGSFNPAHGGHLAISLEALRRLNLDAVWWLVSPQNPLKPAAGMAEFARRLAAARALVADQPRIRVSDLEARLGTRYTIDTVRRLRGYPARFVWLIGADNLIQLPRWKAWRALFGALPIAVFDREPYSYAALSGKAARTFAASRRAAQAARHLVATDPPAWVFLRLRRHPQSGTSLRQQGGSGGRAKGG